MAIKRKLTLKQATTGQQGFLGHDHIARRVIQIPFPESDPFILMMDDLLDKQGGEPVGGPHPHAGFETVSLLLDGEIGDSIHKMRKGDFQMMTAGSGIIHTETIDTESKMRLLQLWLNLPKKDRWAKPRVQDISFNDVPGITEEGLNIKVYSGNFAGVVSPVQNYVPVIIADIKIKSGVTTIQQIPATYTTFLYVIEGSVKVGEENKLLSQHEVGWLDRYKEDSVSELKLSAEESDCRVILYSGKPQGDAIVSHGPFIGDTEDDIKRLYSEFRQGKMNHISEVSEAQRFMW